MAALKVTGLFSGAWASLQSSDCHPLFPKERALSALPTPRPINQDREWRLEFIFGTDLTLSPDPERRGNAFSPQPSARSSHFLCWDLPLPGHLTEGPFIQVRKGCSAARTALLLGPEGRASPSPGHWLPWLHLCVGHVEGLVPPHQVALTFAQNIYTWVPGGCTVSGGHMWAFAALRVVSSEKGKSALGADLRIAFPYGHQLFGASESSSSRARKFPGSGAG